MMTTPVAVSILLATVLVAAYDLQTRKAPNVVTLPLLALGLVTHFPGTAEIWIVSLAIYGAWRASGMGGGDVKLWWALLWLTPPEWMHVAPFVFGGVLVLTAGAQLVGRWWRLGARRRTAWRHEEKTMTAATWRAVPYALWLTMIVAYA